jgi:hypothetical protein
MTLTSTLSIASTMAFAIVVLWMHAKRSDVQPAIS